MYVYTYTHVYIHRHIPNYIDLDIDTRVPFTDGSTHITMCTCVRVHVCAHVHR